MLNKKTFHHIALISRANKQVSDTLHAVKNYLIQQKVAVCIEKDTADILQETTLPIFTEENIPAGVDLMIVVGGDGSLLHAAHCALPTGIPVLGINRGKLGFLTDIHPAQLDKIGEVLSGKYHSEERFLLQTSYGFALNDVVLLPGSPQLIEFDIHINGQFVCQQRADGLIVATPTGSTAYALSGGGPIVHPALNAIVLVPMFPHTLSNRPIVVEGNAGIELVISKNNVTNPMISCDGSEPVPIDRIQITQHPKKLVLIHPIDYDYFGTLREKLGWQRS